MTKSPRDDPFSKLFVTLPNQVVGSQLNPSTSDPKPAFVPSQIEAPVKLILSINPKFERSLALVDGTMSSHSPE